MKKVYRKILSKNIRQKIRKLRNERRRLNKVFTNEMVFDVLPNRFWLGFDSEKWEPETFAFYKKYVSPMKEIIDIGGWIGPTVLIAYSYNPKRISVVEADPANYQILKTNCLKNYLNDKVELNNICIADETGKIVEFGYTDEEVLDTSTKGIGGKRVKVSTISLEDFLKTKDMVNVNIIKIDIEGGEQFIGNGIDYISKFPGINVLLSIHVPFWLDKIKTMEMLLKEFEKFNLYTDRDEKISIDKIRELMLEENEIPYADRKGLFFTIILKTQDNV